MLKSLHITDFAIVANLQVDFFEGLNILSGETGAGKSIILGALNLLLGERASTEMIRTGTDMAVVEGRFEGNPRSSAVLKELDIPSENGRIEIRREVKRNSSSRCFINGSMVTVADLKTVGETLVDLVGQHHGQLLLDSKNHIGFLDNFAGNSKLLENFREVYDCLIKAQTDLDSLEKKIQSEREKTELYRFQSEEIQSAGLSAEEENSLNSEKQILENAEKLKSAYYKIASSIYQDENSVTDIVTSSLSELERLQKLDDSLSDTIKSLKDSLYTLQEAGRFLEGRSEEIGHDPARLEEIEERLELYYKLKKKYGGSIEALLAYRSEIDSALLNFTDWSERLTQLRAERANYLKQAQELAGQLSDKRRTASAKLAKQISAALDKLNMGRVEFKVAVENKFAESRIKNDSEISMDRDGFDLVEFLFSPNPGEELKALAKIASGGELSRVLLALKSIVSGKNKSACLVFDEIDTGIGGKTASAVGKSLQDLAGDHQVIVITHLQQIASCGENHFLVFKEKSEGRMTTRIKKLTLKQRKEEIGRMISGDNVTRLSIKQAEELLNNDKK